MYDDLARAVRPSALEWVVLNAVIPSVLLTLALRRPNTDGPQPLLRYAFMCTLAVSTLEAVVDPAPPIPDEFPILVSMPRPVYPHVMWRDGIEGRVVLRALVNVDGRVDSTSILVVQMTDGAFATAAFHALARAQFRPARFGGRAGAAWITIAIDFTMRQE